MWHEDDSNEDECNDEDKNDDRPYRVTLKIMPY